MPSLHPYFEWFGVDTGAMRKVLAEAMGRGAEYADLYFEHARNTSISLEDGIISRASTGVDQGVGVRAVMGDQVSWIRDRTHPRVVTEANGRDSLAIACAADALARQPGGDR